MRLLPQYKETIKRSFLEVFGQGEVYLFGSRTNDAKRGGDIDLFLEIEDKRDLFAKKLKFLARIKKRLGEQKIDVVFNEDPKRLIEKEARKWAIKL